MRAGLTILSLGTIAFALFLTLHSDAPPATRSETRSLTSSTKPDFETDIKPILQARCQPCHFQGGQMYDKLPFDKPSTITKLGTRLFTRIKEEKERHTIQEFLDASNSASQNR